MTGALVAAVALVVLAAVPAAASTTDLSGTYEGTFEVTVLAAPEEAARTLRPPTEGPQEVPEVEPWDGAVRLACDGSTCTITSTSPTLRQREPLVVTITGGTGTLEIPQEYEGESICPITLPPHVFTVDADGERVDLRYEDPAYAQEANGCGFRTWVYAKGGKIETFSGTLAGASDGGGAPVGVIAGGAVVLAGAVAAGVVVRRRPGRERRARSSEAPEVRAVHDGGRQSIRMSDR